MIYNLDDEDDTITELEDDCPPEDYEDEDFECSWGEDDYDEEIEDEEEE